MQQPVVDGAGRHSERRVDRALGLLRTARIVGDDLVALDVKVDRDRVGDGFDAVVLDHVFEAVDPVRERGQFGAHPALGIIHQVLAGLAEHIQAVFADDLLDAVHAEIDRADHRPEVAVVLPGRSRVGEQQLPDLVDVLARLLDMHGRDAQALMEDLGRLAAEGARHHAADLRDMADADGEAEQLAVREERLEERVLGTVQAAAIGVVVQHDVALASEAKSTSCEIVLMRIGMPPIMVGQNSAQAIMSPLASESAQVKSRPSLKIVE